MLPARRFNLPDIFNDFFDNGGIERINAKTPAINVIEGENTYKIEVATPGMTKDDFKVHVNKDGNLVIEMEKTDCCCKGKEKEKKECRYLRKEFAYSKFNQTLLLPDNADRENIVIYGTPGSYAQTFAGWYKDSKFKNKWDFLRDKAKKEIIFCHIITLVFGVLYDFR